VPLPANENNGCKRHRDGNPEPPKGRNFDILAARSGGEDVGSDYALCIEKVAGRNSMVSAAIEFILVLSSFVSLENWELLAASYWVTRL
jgi:hypothetical protein